jgi:hypothetical protein
MRLHFPFICFLFFCLLGLLFASMIRILQISEGLLYFLTRSTCLSPGHTYKQPMFPMRALTGTANRPTYHWGTEGSHIQSLWPFIAYSDSQHKYIKTRHTAIRLSVGVAAYTKNVWSCTSTPRHVFTAREQIYLSLRPIARDTRKCTSLKNYATGRSRVRFLTRSLEYSIHLILPAAL